MDLSCLIKHSDVVKDELLSLLDKGEEIYAGDFKAFCVSSSFEGCDWSSARMIELFCNVYYQGETGTIEGSGVLVAEHTIYRINSDYSLFQTLDNISSHDATVGEAMERVYGEGDADITDELYDEECLCNENPYVLGDFRVTNEFRGKGLGYLCLHLGLQAAGVERNPLFIYPARASEAKDRDGNEKAEFSDWKFLKKFYLKMDSGMKLIEDYNTIYTLSYNYQSSVYENRKAR